MTTDSRDTPTPPPGTDGETDSPEQDPGHSFRSAVGWSFVLTGGQRLFGFLVTLVLAGLLGPKAYGTVAMAMVFVLFTQVFLLQGLLPALIQRRGLGDRQLTSAFWLGMALSVAFAGLAVALSGWWASVNDLPDLQIVIIALCPLLPISALMLVQEAWLRKRLEFKKLAIRANVSVVAGGILGLVSAAAGAGIWALVIQQLATQCVGVIVLWRVSSWRPSFHFSWAEVRPLLSFSASASASAVGGFLSTSGDALIIGVFFGPAAVGLYQLATRVVQTVVEVMAMSLQEVALPELARLQHDPGGIRRRLDSMLSLGARTTVPLLAVVAIASPWFAAVLGPRWADASTVIRILALVGVMRLFSAFSAPVLQALNHPHLLAVLVWSISVLSVGFGIGTGLVLRDSSVATQVNGMALANVVLFLIIVTINSRVFKVFAGLDVRAQLRAVGLPLAIGSAAVGVAVVVESIGPGLGGPPVLSLAVVVVAGACLVGAMMFALDQRTRTMLLEALNGARAAVSERGASRPAQS